METTDLEYLASEISRILDSGIEIMPNSPIHLKLKQALALLSVVRQSEQLIICKNCGSKNMYQYTKSLDKCDDCGYTQNY